MTDAGDEKKNLTKVESKLNEYRDHLIATWDKVGPGLNTEYSFNDALDAIMRKVGGTDWKGVSNVGTILKMYREDNELKYTTDKDPSSTEDGCLLGDGNLFVDFIYGCIDATGSGKPEDGGDHITEEDMVSLICAVNVIPDPFKMVFD